jgi:hypothetical protein
MHSALRFLLKVPPVALYITKPKHSSELWAGKPAARNAEVCGKLVITVKLSIIVKSPSIPGAVSAAIGNFYPLYSRSNHPRRHAVRLPALSTLHTAPIELYST